MTHRLSRSPFLRLWAAFAAAAAFLVLSPPAVLAEGAKAESSLHLVPGDAVFYGAMLRNREQIDAVLKSKAWARLAGLPVVQMAIKQLQEQLAKPNPQVAQVLQLLEQPENKELLGLLGEMFADEVFVYGGDSLGGLVEVLAQMQGTMQWAKAIKLINKQAGQDPTQAQVRMLLDVLKENLDQLKAPELVIGFKLRDNKAAEAQLQRLADLLEPLADQVKPLKGRLKKVKGKGGSMLTLALDGKMVPWNDLPIKDLEEKDGDYDALLKKLAGLKMTISLGLRDNYLILAFSESLEALDKLGGKGAKLVDRPELKPLTKFADKPLTSVGYVSKALREKAGFGRKDLDGVVEAANAGLDLVPIPEGQKRRIKKDVADLAKEIKSTIGETGASLSFSFLTERGNESYAYDYCKQPLGDKPEPLTLLNHLDGDPILATVVRARFTPEQYGTLVKWIKVIHGHAEEFALAQLDDNIKEAYDKAGKEIYPLLKRFDQINAKMLLPALADGQSAFVLDAKWKSKHWQKQLPATPAAMPLPEIGFVLGVSDVVQLRKAMTEYRKLLNDALALASKMSGGQVPEIQVPEPETVERKSAMLYFYPIPPMLGLDKRVVPTAGLSDDVAVLTLSNDHAERLLTKQPIKTEGGPLSDPKRPLISAVYFNSAALIDALTPWAELGATAAYQQFAREGGEEGEKIPFKDVNDLLKQVRTVLDVMKVFKGTTSATYLEEGVLVTHSETVIRDLK